MFNGTIKEMEKVMVLGALNKFNGNIRKAAELLEVPERTMARKILKHKLKRNSYYVEE